MFFFLSKFFAFFTKPSNLLFLLALTGLVLMATRFSRAGRRLLVVSVILLLLFGISPLGRQLVLVLESRFPAWDASRGAPDGIIVLGGAIAPEVSAARGEIALSGAAERMTVVADLARRYPSAKIVFTGGSAALFGGPPRSRLCAAALGKLRHRARPHSCWNAIPATPSRTRP